MMKKLFVCAAIAGLILAGCEHMGGHDSGGQHMSESSSMSSGGETQTTQYTCPMHPEVVQDSPGTCPKCGMKLVPKG